MTVFDKHNYVRRIREVSAKQRLSMTALRKKIGMSKAWFDKMMNPGEEKNFRIDEHEKICRALNTTHLYLRHGAGPSYVSERTLRSMMKIMDAYADPDRPHIALLMQQLSEMHYDDVQVLCASASHLNEIRAFAGGVRHTG